MCARANADFFAVSAFGLHFIADRGNSDPFSLLALFRRAIFQGGVYLQVGGVKNECGCVNVALWCNV